MPMASPSAVVTVGTGSPWGSPSLILTLGYAPADAGPPPSTNEAQLGDWTRPAGVQMASRVAGIRVSTSQPRARP